MGPTARYKAIYGTMPKEQQEDCDWVKAQDDAREDAEPSSTMERMACEHEDVLF